MTRDLPELLVSLALGGLVISGALQMHTAFSRQSERQKEVAESQEALRLSMRLLESAVRSAGSAAPVVANDQGQCPGGPRPMLPLDWSNGRLRVIGVRSGAPVVVSGEGGGELRVVRGDASGLTEGDLFQVLAPGGACTREVTATRKGALIHEPVASCFNPAPADDRCLARCTSTQPCPLRRLPGAIEFRVERGRLVTRRGPLGDESRPWTQVADNLQALEVTFVCDGGGACDAARAVAVRITLGAKGRSLTELIALRNVS